MRLQHRLFALLATSSLMAGALSALADDGAPPPLPHKEFCKDNPGKCEEARAKRQEFCKTSPEKCEQMKQKHAERREFCKANPEKCKKQREEMHARRAEMEARCKADPAKCEEMKDQARQKMHDWMGKPPPAPPPAK